jgi:hypothetical protein
MQYSFPTVCALKTVLAAYDAIKCEVEKVVLGIGKEYNSVVVRGSWSGISNNDNARGLLRWLFFRLSSYSLQNLRI